MGNVLTGVIWLRIGTSVGSCENKNGHSSPIKEFFEQLNNY
jgi:hypothetical protein